jgi:uncharacterized GH25 family protein
MKQSPWITRMAAKLVRLTLLAGMVALAQPATAHDFWIEPGSHTPALGEAVSVRLRVGEHFRGDPVPRPAPQGLHRFVLADTRGGPAASVPGRPGAEPAGQVRLPQPGRYVIGHHGKPIAIELPAEVFNPYLKEEGLDAVIQARAARGQTDTPGREIYSRHAKSLLKVGRAADSDGAPPDRVLGFVLELVVEAWPLASSGSALLVRLLLDGQPLAGALVMALRHDAPSRRLEQRSDADGRVQLALDGAGPWLVKAVHMRAAPADSGADWESLWASLTLQVADADE